MSGRPALRAATGFRLRVFRGYSGGLRYWKPLFAGFLMRMIVRVRVMERKHSLRIEWHAYRR